MFVRLRSGQTCPGRLCASRAIVYGASLERNLRGGAVASWRPGRHIWRLMDATAARVFFDSAPASPLLYGYSRTARSYPSRTTCILQSGRERARRVGSARLGRSCSSGSRKERKPRESIHQSHSAGTRVLTRITRHQDTWQGTRRHPPIMPSKLRVNASSAPVAVIQSLKPELNQKNNAHFNKSGNNHG